MHIYFNIPNGDCSKVPFAKDCGTVFTLFDKVAKQFAPHLYYVEVDDEFFTLTDELKEFFVKATIRSYPDFQLLNHPGRPHGIVKRSYGVYFLGKAKAELTPHFSASSGRNYLLTIETTKWEGLKDIKKLEKEIWAGTIIPAIPYDREQRIIHPLDVLKQLLSKRKLGWIKKFFLSMRMLAQ